jgi:DNA modification methylase
MEKRTEYFTIKEASIWATNYLKKLTTTSNILYLINYGHVPKIDHEGLTKISKSDLMGYYYSLNKYKKIAWGKSEKHNLLNWNLSFENLKESKTTKHVHKLHPYKGKFIPQLVEYFLDDHTDSFKTEKYFNKGDIILDPFCGSGTTLVQANELGIHAIGIDIAYFNVIVSNCKINEHKIINLKEEIKRITIKSYEKIKSSNIVDFDNALSYQLKWFNSLFFKIPKFRYNTMYKNENIDKEKKFLSIYKNLVLKYKIELLNANPKTFLEKWYFKNVCAEMYFIKNEIEKIKDNDIRHMLILIMSRTMRSCRATMHSNLTTLIEPISTTYYCQKHAKICKPIFSIMKWWKTYARDTIDRLEEFEKLRTNTYQYCINGDSRTLNIKTAISLLKNRNIANALKNKEFAGIFTSPPYLGLINYHEQHAYIYDLFNFKRNDEFEIGSMTNGHSEIAKKKYIIDISNTLNNCKKLLKKHYNIFLVANDKYDLYSKIAKKSGMVIVNTFQRPVLNRTERNKPYTETVFHLKKKL